MNWLSEYNSKFQVKMLRRTWDIWKWMEFRSITQNFKSKCWVEPEIFEILQLTVEKIGFYTIFSKRSYSKWRTYFLIVLNCMCVFIYPTYSFCTKCELKYISPHAYRTLLISFILFVHVSTSWFVFTNCNRRLKLFSNLAPACNTYTINKRIYWPINWLVTVVSNSSICYAAFCWYKYRPEYSTL